MGFFSFWGVDQDSMPGAKKKLFFYAFPPQKTVTPSSDGRAHIRNRSGVVELVGREPLIFAKVENGVTEFSTKKQKTPKFWIRNSARQFSVKNFHFFGRRKTNFWGGGYTFKTS